MLDDHTNLSPDLEWMLQSGQVDDLTIIDSLARQYYQPVYHLLLSKLTYPEEARSAAQETFVQAALNVKNYRADIPIIDWLVSITTEIYQARSSHLDDHLLLNAKLISSILRHQPEEVFAMHQIDQAIHEIQSQVAARRVARSKRVGIQELGLIAIAILGAFIVFRLINLKISAASQPEMAGAASSLSQLTNSLFENVIPKRDNPAIDLTSIARGGIPPQEPLTLQSSHEDIWRRMLFSLYLWESLWVEVRVILRGPVDYIGQPHAERHQLWLSRDQEGLHLSGPLEDIPERIEKITSSNLGPEPTTFLSGNEDYSRLGSQIPWFYISSDTVSSIPYMTNFFFIADYDFPPQRLRYRVIEENEWAGRPVVIVEISDQNGLLQAHLWLDSIFGIALREQFFGADSENSIRLETSVTKIEYNVDFPVDLSQSIHQAGLDIAYAQDHTGKPESPDDRTSLSPWIALSSRIASPMSLPPADFDPSQSRLSFAEEEAGLTRLNQFTTVHVFADNYFLGKIDLLDPFRTNCARSSDGGRIVISQWSQSPAQYSSIIGWYDLKDLKVTESTVSDTLITRLVFSPDSRYIAAAGIEQMTGKSRLYLIDTETGNLELLPEIEDVWSLAWSPDGTKLASLNWPSFRMYTRSTLRINIYDIPEKAITSVLRDANFPWGMSSVEIPLQGWTVKFPLSMGGLEPCAIPPRDP